MQSIEKSAYQSKYSIHLPEPCPFDLGKMPKTEKGVFCTGCSKEVIDFTAYKEDELQRFIKDNIGKNFCGTFHPSQIARPVNRKYKGFNYLLHTIIGISLVLFSGCKSTFMGIISRKNKSSAGDIILPVHDRKECHRPEGPSSGPPVIRVDTAKYEVDTVFSRESLGNIYFNSGSHKLKNEAKKTLDTIAEVLKHRSNYVMYIYGHTDSTGKEKDNVDLSYQRANEVKQYLKQQGFRFEDVTLGFASNKPAAPNNSRKERKLNRRTEVSIMKYELIRRRKYKQK
jgi:outer membrane protein OmpA-like peptidoglycan-associated protein